MRPTGSSSYEYGNSSSEPRDGRCCDGEAEAGEAPASASPSPAAAWPREGAPMLPLPALPLPPPGVPRPLRVPRPSPTLPAGLLLSVSYACGRAKSGRAPVEIGAVAKPPREAGSATMGGPLSGLRAKFGELAFARAPPSPPLGVAPAPMAAPPSLVPGALTEADMRLSSSLICERESGWLLGAPVLACRARDAPGAPPRRAKLPVPSPLEAGSAAVDDPPERGSSGRARLGEA